MASTKRAPSYRVDAHGNYTFRGKQNADDILKLAAQILENRICTGEVLARVEDTKRYLSVRLGTLEHEVFACLFLNTRHRLISFEILFYGTIDGTSVYPREVLKRALALNAAAVIFTHNHPSGVAEPSRADEHLTRRLKDALAMVDIRVLDHIVVGGPFTVSFAELGLL